MSACIPSVICHQEQLGSKNVTDSIHGWAKSEGKSWVVEPLKSDFHVVSWVFRFLQHLQELDFYLKPISFPPSMVHLADFAICWKKNLKKTLPVSDLLPSCVCVAADNYPGCARLWERYCHASHAWHPLCESASSCSAICPRPGSLIREESCGKVCVSLLDAPLSLQLFVRVGPRQQHRGARDHYAAAGVWGAHWHCENRKGEELEAVHGNTRQTDTHPLRITVLSFDMMAVILELLCIETPNA